MHTKHIVGVAIGMLIATSGIGACDDDDDVVRVFPNGGTGPIIGDGTQTGTATFTSAEVASIALVLNMGEVEQGRVAIQRATSPEVRAYAERMVNDHTLAMQRIDSQLPPGALGVNDPTAAVLARADRIVTQDLETQGGAAFDLAYMTNQMAAHAKALSLIDRSLVPSAQAGTTSIDTIVLQELQTERTAVVQHLDEALRIQARVRGAPPVIP